MNAIPQYTATLLEAKLRPVFASGMEAARPAK